MANVSQLRDSGDSKVTEPSASSSCISLSRRSSHINSGHRRSCTSRGWRSSHSPPKTVLVQATTHSSKPPRSHNVAQICMSSSTSGFIHGASRSRAVTNISPRATSRHWDWDALGKGQSAQLVGARSSVFVTRRVCITVVHRDDGLSFDARKNIAGGSDGGLGATVVPVSGSLTSRFDGLAGWGVDGERDDATDALAVVPFAAGISERHCRQCDHLVLCLVMYWVVLAGARGLWRCLIGRHIREQSTSAFRAVVGAQTSRRTNQGEAKPSTHRSNFLHVAGNKRKARSVTPQQR